MSCPDATELCMKEPVVLRYTVEQAANNQNKFSKKYLFAPMSGLCYSCSRNIYSDPYTNSVSGEKLITSCPFCNASFVE